MVTHFSQSSIWDLQHTYFQESGIDAWRTKDVPHYITSNPFMGKVYAEMVLAILKDTPLVNDETVYIVEAGAGHGRFCYHFLKHLEVLIAETTAPLPRWCYVLTDISENMLAYWGSHPRLQSYIAEGRLDMAIVDASAREPIHLRISNQTITSGSLAQPLVVIANYFFDTIPQELFYVGKDEQLSYVDIEVHVDNRNTAAESIADLLPVFSTGQQIEEPYQDPALHALVKYYTSTLSDNYLLFPHTGIGFLEYMRSLSKKGCIVLTADKGYHRLDELQQAFAPEIVKHGSFSVPVNFHAFKQYAMHTGGISLFPLQPNYSLTVGCLLLIPKAEGYRQTTAAYRKWVNDFGPDDFYTLKNVLAEKAGGMDIRGLVATIRLSGFDARYFQQVAWRLFELATGIAEKEKWLLFQTVHRIWDMYYPMSESYDLAADIGELLYKLHFYPESLRYFELSMDIYGRSVKSLYNSALCLFYSKRYDDVKVFVAEILAADPGHVATAELLAKL